MKLEKLIEISRALGGDFSSHSIRSFHVSFLLRRSKILSIGINSARTHPTNLKNRKFGRDGKNISNLKFQCSEFCCLQKSRNQNINYRKCRMVNVRLTRNNDLGLAAPCESCQSLLAHYKIKNVIFTNDLGGFTQTVF